jgi:hypothetical protein
MSAHQTLSLIDDGWLVVPELARYDHMNAAPDRGQLPPV